MDVVMSALDAPQVAFDWYRAHSLDVSLWYAAMAFHVGGTVGAVFILWNFGVPVPTWGHIRVIKGAQKGALMGSIISCALTSAPFALCFQPVTLFEFVTDGATLVFLWAGANRLLPLIPGAAR